MTEKGYTVEWKRLADKLSGLERYAPRNAMKAASTSAFRAIDYQNAQIIKAAPFKTPNHRPSFRNTASKKGGYRYRVKQFRNGDTFAQGAYAKRSKRPEMAHATIIENGYASKNGQVPGRNFRRDAFKVGRRRAEKRMVDAMRIALDLAAAHPKGRVKVGDVERTVGGWGP